MKYLTVVLVALALLCGCRVPPFNPQADVRLLTFTDTSNVAISSLTVSGAGPHTIKAQVSIYNGVDTYFTAYRVEYFDVSGAQYPVVVQNLISVQIQGSGATQAQVTGYVPFAVTTPEVVAYKTANAISQMNARVTLTGNDVNNNNVSVAGNFSLY